MDITRRRIPLRITPDRLTNAVVKIAIEDRYSSSFLEGKLVSGYNQRHPEMELTQLKVKTNNGNDEPRFFYANSQFRVILIKNTIAFNFVTAYPGWNTYNGWISDFLNSDIDISFKGVSMRYISEYQNIHIFSPNVLDGNVALNHVPEFAGTELQYQCNLHDFEDHTIIGSAKVKLINAEIIQGIDGYKSKIDITVASNPIDGDSGILYEVMNKLHRHEKTLFFAMLNDNFVYTLNPEYE